MPNTCPIKNITAPSGDRALLPCPIQPGALLQYYSVAWMKASVTIAELTTTNPQDIRKTDSRYDIDRATYALIIDPVSVNDTNTNYQCQVSVQNPMTNTQQQLRYNLQPMSVSLTIISKLIFSIADTHINVVKNLDRVQLVILLTATDYHCILFFL